jgi:hypothetical protein
MVEVRFSTCFIGDENKLHHPLSRGDGRHHVFGSTVCRYKVHVTRRDANEGRHVVVAPDGGRVPWGVVPYWEDKGDLKGGLAAFR